MKPKIKLCACGCKKPAREGSKYSALICKNRNADRRRRARNKRLGRKKTRFLSMVIPPLKLFKVSIRGRVTVAGQALRVTGSVKVPARTAAEARRIIARRIEAQREHRTVTLRVTHAGRSSGAPVESRNECPTCSWPVRPDGTCATGCKRDDALGEHAVVKLPPDGSPGAVALEARATELLHENAASAALATEETP